MTWAMFVAAANERFAATDAYDVVIELGDARIRVACTAWGRRYEWAGALTDINQSLQKRAAIRWIDHLRARA